MTKKIFKSKYFWLLTILAFIFIYGLTFHLKLKKRAEVLALLQNSPNATIKFIRPNWSKKLPTKLVKYFEPSFPIQLELTFLEDNFSLFAEDDVKENLKYDSLPSVLNKLDTLNSLHIKLPSPLDKPVKQNIDFLLKCKHLESLRISGSRLSLSEDYQLLKLKVLEIHCTDITDNIFRTIGNLPNLQTLAINSKEFLSTPQLDHLKKLNSLEYLFLNGVTFRDNDFTFLKSLSSVVNLNLEPDWVEVTHYPGLLQNIQNLSKLKNLQAYIKLSRENLQLINSNSTIPYIHFLYDENIDDDYIAMLEQVAEKKKDFFSHRCSLKGHQLVGDRSIPFINSQAYSKLNLHGTSISKLKDLRLAEYDEIYFPATGNLEGVIEKLTAERYRVLDFTKLPISEIQLKQLLDQTYPMALYLSGEYTAKAVDIVMKAFAKYPKRIMKVSFGDWTIPETHREKFLKRVNQWGMSVVYTSHLAEDFKMADWHIQRSRKFIHDKKGNLKYITSSFPLLKSINLKGKAVSLEEWQSLNQLTNFDSLYLESVQSGNALNKSGVLNKLENLIIKKTPSSPLKIPTNITSLRVYLDNSPLLHTIDCSAGGPESLRISGKGIFNPADLKGATNLQSLIIDQGIKVQGHFPELLNLRKLHITDHTDRDALKSLANLAHLEIIAVNCLALDSKTFESWANLKKLSVLNLTSANLGDQDMKVLASLPKLKALELPASEKITTKTLEVLYKMPKLERVKFIGTSIYSEDLEKEYSALGSWDYEM